jgi:hypothetical protein
MTRSRACLPGGEAARHPAITFYTWEEEEFVLFLFS